MLNLTYKEAYVLSFINSNIKNVDISNISSILLGLYACDFLDTLETRGGLNPNKKNLTLQELIKELFFDSNPLLKSENILLPVLKKLNELNLLKIKREKIFHYFSLIHFTHKKNTIHKKSLQVGNLNKFIIESIEKFKSIENRSLLKRIVMLFNKQLFSFIKTYEKKHSKYELRYFWPDRILPEAYDCIGSLFERNNYKKENTIDTYIITEDNLNLKLRNNELYVMNSLPAFHNISHFTKKRKINYPNDISPEILRYPHVEVIKDRHLNKFRPHSQIEISLIEVQEQKWKTICIESKEITIVLALSMLINPENSEMLTYTEFLNKYKKSGV